MATALWVPTPGKRFASPINKKHPRAKRAVARGIGKSAAVLSPFSISIRSATPVEMPSSQDIVLTASTGKQLEMNYQKHELPSERDAMYV